MRRVLVLGSSGAGKSTLARRIGERLALPVVHLDACHFRPGWDPLPPDEWRARVAALVAEERWVMDGNYGGTLDLRLPACDTVIFLDRSRWVCLARAVRRWLRLRGRTRPDVAPGCPEKMDREFVRWIWTYPRRSRPGVLRRLAALGAGQRVVVLRSDAEVERFLRALPSAR